MEEEQYRSSELLTKRLGRDKGEGKGRFSAIKNRMHGIRTKFGDKEGGRVVGGSLNRASGKDYGEAAPASAAAKEEGRPVLERMSAPPFGSSPHSARQSSMPSSPTYFERMSASVKEEGSGMEKVNSPFHWCDIVEGSAYNQSSGVLSYDMDAYRHGQFTPYDPSKSMKQYDGVE
jgi:hypothetical protein